MYFDFKVDITRAGYKGLLNLFLWQASLLGARPDHVGRRWALSHPRKWEVELNQGSQGSLVPTLANCGTSSKSYLASKIPTANHHLNMSPQPTSVTSSWSGATTSAPTFGLFCQTLSPTHRSILHIQGQIEFGVWHDKFKLVGDRLQAKLFTDNWYIHLCFFKFLKQTSGQAVGTYGFVLAPHTLNAHVLCLEDAGHAYMMVNLYNSVTFTQAVYNLEVLQRRGRGASS